MPLLNTLKRPTIALLSERLARLATAALLTVIVARVLGAGSLGLLSIVMAWASFLVPMASLGLNNIVVRQVTERTDEADAIATLYTALLLRLALGMASAVLMLLVFYRYAPAELGQIPLASVAALFFWQAFYSLILCEFFLNYQGQYHQLAWLKVTITLTAFAGRLVLLWLGFGVAALIVVAGLEFAVVGVVQYMQFRRLHRPLTANGERWPRLSFRQFSLTQARTLLRGSAWLWLSAMVSVLYLKADLLMIGVLIGSEPAGLYAAASRLSELWYVFPATLAVRYYPDLLDRYRRSETDYLITLRRRAGWFFLAGVGVAIGMSVGAPWVVSVLFGSEFAPAVSVLRIHVWAGCFFFLQYLVHQHLVITGQEPLTLLSHGGGALINVLLNLWLIPTLGITGAAWATLVSYAFAAFFFLFLSPVTRRQLRAMMLVKVSA